MEQYKLEANEQFFDLIINTLKDGGTWAWPNELEIFIKQGDKLTSTQDALDKVKEIVRQSYFEKRFSLKK